MWADLKGKACRAKRVSLRASANRGAFPAGCRDGDAALWGLGSHGTVRQLDKMITEHAQRVETIDQLERPKDPPCQ